MVSVCSLIPFDEICIKIIISIYVPRLEILKSVLLIFLTNNLNLMDKLTF